LHDIIIGNNFPVSLVQLLQVSNYSCTSLNDGIPSCLEDYSDVFISKTAKLPLPEHRPYDLGIILQNDIPLPTSKKIYSLSTPERALLKENLDDALDRQWICPSTSPLTSPCFFVKQHNKLRMCVDYRELNDITSKDENPLPLIQDIFDMLSEATVFKTRPA
jgi:hypothetical protein